jgi:hypothetical protein
MLIIDQYIVLLYPKAIGKLHIFCDRENWKPRLEVQWMQRYIEKMVMARRAARYLQA